MCEFTPHCPYCAVEAVFDYVAVGTNCKVEYTRAGPAYCPECGAVQDAAIYDMCQDVEERWVTLVFDRHRYADLLRRSDLNERLSALVKLVQPLCKNEVTACGTPEGTTISGVTLSPQLLRDFHQVGIQVIPLVK